VFVHPISRYELSSAAHHYQIGRQAPELLEAKFVGVADGVRRRASACGLRKNLEEGSAGVVNEADAQSR
jgi:hypothetical protein